MEYHYILILCLIGCIVHAYCMRGTMAAFNFFLFMFLFSFTKGGEHLLSFAGMSPAEISPLVSALSSAEVLMIVVYLSWFFAEKIASRLGSFGNGIFPVVLFSSFIIVAFGCAIETISISWQVWERTYPSTIIDVINGWFCFSVYFLSAFFLIIFSKYRVKAGKTIFFLLPFIHRWLPLFFKNEYTQSIEIVIVAGILLVLAYINPLQFEQREEAVCCCRGRLNGKLIAQLPVILIVCLFVMGLFSFMRMPSMQTVSTFIPLLFMVLLAIEKIPFLLVIGLFLMVFGISWPQGFVNILPPAVFLLLYCRNKVSRNRT